MKNIDKNRKTIEAYDKNVQFYADKFDSYGIRIDDIGRALKLNESGSNKVLELGCGNGRDAQYIISKVGIHNYTGIDASIRLIKLAVDKLAEVPFHVKDMRKGFGVNHETFGVIFSFYSMLHVNRDDLVEVIQNCHKSLKIGGILYISSKFGDYKEMEIENLGDKKYYYSYQPEDLEGLGGDRFETVYKTIHDSEYGPSFTLALRKLK